MVASYSRHVAEMIPNDGFLTLSRRDIEPPKYRITRFHGWKTSINPWKEKHRLPVLEGGLLGKLLYDGEPRIIDELQVDPNDPGEEYLRGQRSLAVIPQLDGGVALNMIVATRKVPNGFDRDQFPEIVWQSILFGRTTHNLVLAGQVKEAYDVIDRELQLVGDIQRSLLPAQLPDIPTMKLAAHYQTSHRAGGDYYDFFPLPDGRWGILIADVSGHGTPAAVMMAVTHSIAHLYPGTSAPPSDMLDFVSGHLTHRYTNNVSSFVTAFYAIYDPRTRELSYSSAGHNPPRLKRCAGGEISALDGASKYPLGIFPDVAYEDATVRLHPGDQLVFYTDGVVEAVDPADCMFGVGRLEQVLAECRNEPQEIVAAVLHALGQFTAGQTATDDRTLVVAKIE